MPANRGHEIDDAAAPRARVARRGSRWKVVAVLLLAALAAGVIGGAAVLQTRRGEHLTDLAAVPPGTTLPVPAFRHVYLIVLENKEEEDVVGAADAPYLGELIDRYGLTTSYQAIAHPSQPNYIALFSGSTHDVLDDEVHDIVGENLADQLEAAGRTWRVFAENVPAAGCFSGASASGGPDGSGLYVRKHNPAISFTSISTTAERCANIQPFARFDPAAADFELIVPNMCHIMHDCSVAVGDEWLARFVPRILDSAAWKDGGVLFITFDETAHSTAANEVATLVIAPGVEPGERSGVAHSHYSLLRTIETGLGVPCLVEACNANTLGEFFGP
jgi:acid phosphatase